MKTVNKNQVENTNQGVNLSEEKKVKDGMAREAAVGTMGGVVGGVAGAALGSVVAQEANAQEAADVTAVTPEPVSANSHVAPVNSESKPESEPTLEPQPEPEPTSEPQPESEPTSEPQPEPEPEVQVLHYEINQTPEGQTIQTASVSINDEVVQLADVNGDDIIDLAATDRNHDGEITADEFSDVSGENMSMQPFREAYQEDPLIAQNSAEGPDYINDGNVDDYMA